MNTETEARKILKRTLRDARVIADIAVTSIVIDEGETGDFQISEEDFENLVAAEMLASTARRLAKKAMRKTDPDKLYDAACQACIHKDLAGRFLNRVVIVDEFDYGFDHLCYFGVKNKKRLAEVAKHIDISGLKAKAA